MKSLIILAAVPFFLLLIGLELWLSRRQGQKLYRFNDTITNLNIGIGNQVFNLFFKLFLVGIYVWAFENMAFLHLPAAVWTGVLALIAYDFLFYWAHRWSHEINFFWGAHVVHHSSEEYNLSVALRQSWFHNILAFFIFMPMPLLGFDPSVFVIAAAFHTLYQFWIHTRTIDRLHPWIEAIFNTPSHHRVHHGVNPQYIDKNHGGVFIVWDRLFGTFAREREEVVYGITTPLKSWNPSWANLHYYVEMFQLGKLLKGWDRVKVLFARPGWRPAYLGGTLSIPEADPKKPKYNALSNKWLNLYVFVQFVLILSGVCAFMYFFDEISWFYRLVFCGILILSTMICGAIMENRSWVVPAEYLRLVLVLVALNSFYYFWYWDWFWVMVVGSGLGFVAFNLWFTLGRIWSKKERSLA